MNLLKTTVALALAGIGSMAHAVSYDINNSLSAWLTSAGTVGANVIGIGTFVGDGCPPGVACNGVKTQSVPGVSIAQQGGGSASYNGSNLLNNNAGSSYLEWTFAKPQNGWGGTFTMPVGNGLSITANDHVLGWIDVTSVGAGQSLNGFLGFTSADKFSGVRVSAIGGSASSYLQSDFSVAAVPEPETYAMMMAGLLALGLRARRKAKA